MVRAAPSNIEIVFSDWLDAMRRGDIDLIATRLHPDVVHTGIHPDLICRGRDEVLDNLGARAAARPQIDAIELIAAGDHVVISIRGPDVGVPAPDAEQKPRGQATVVFTLRGGLIVEMRDHVHREDALASVGATGDWI